MQNIKIRDPALTPLGKEQAQKLISDPVLARALVAGTGRAEAVVVSPLQRTLQTAVIGLGAGTGSAGLSDVKCVASNTPRVCAALARSLCLRESLIQENCFVQTAGSSHSRTAKKSTTSRLTRDDQ